MNMINVLLIVFFLSMSLLAQNTKVMNSNDRLKENFDNVIYSFKEN